MSSPADSENTPAGLRQRGESQMESTSSVKNSAGTAGIFAGMDPRWKNWWIRGVFAFVMIAVFVMIVLMGPLFLTLLVITVQVKCFHEIISIGLMKYREYNLPLYRVLNWYLLLVANYYSLGTNMFYYYPDYKEHLYTAAHYHKMISFLLYVTGFVFFVLTLKRDYYRVQFSLLAWTHITLLMFVSVSHLIIQNVYEGVYWFLMPVSLVICNDIMAYVSGFFFGKTPLIKLSPKKTWEGFIGAFFWTVVFALLFAYFLSSVEYFVCYPNSGPCERDPLYRYKQYNLPKIPFGEGATFSMYPAVLHSIPLAIFASIIAPFGGFFASGFKRAFRIKDFGDLIPGHGGIVDRFDCQVLMAAFANIYYFSFCRTLNPEHVIKSILSLTVEQQVEVLHKLNESLTSRGLF
ncbi:phosphatidate cytidylyltransferase 2-like [Dysidea avara]|uniref:phosphatidate cytidylyltransferase 2-like n=1 Tax=Dysidea avara TaxID=196820 RepID=UPI0033251716